eukprot:6206458-Pleurochrysis_carterae.AAC.1
MHTCLQITQYHTWCSRVFLTSSPIERTLLIPRTIAVFATYLCLDAVQIHGEIVTRLSDGLSADGRSTYRLRAKTVMTSHV